MKMDVIVGGVNLTERYGVILDTENSEFNPPELRTNYLDIPGMDGVLDLSEALTDDTNYEQRHDSMVFGVMYPREFEEMRTKLLNFLHGRDADYQLSWEPGYVYHGRFMADAAYSRLHYGEIRFAVDADPWRRADPVHLEIPAAQGVEAHLPNRRRRVSPTILTHSETVIGYKTQSWVLDPGETYLNELVLDPGDNVVFIDSKPSAGTNTWNDVLRLFGQSATWNQIKEMRWSELAKYGQTIKEDATSIVTISYDTYDL